MEKSQLTYVDRIDYSKIRVCGHNLPVTRIEKLGVIIFHHPDGTPCSLLNSLRLNADAINAEDALLSQAKGRAGSIVEKLDAPIVYSRLSTDKDLVERLAEELDEEKDLKRLEDAFLKIARGKNAVDVFRAIGAALGPEKNRIVLNNVAAVFTKQYRDGSIAELQHLYPLVLEAQQVLSEKRNSTKR